MAIAGPWDRPAVTYLPTDPRIHYLPQVPAPHRPTPIPTQQEGSPMPTTFTIQKPLTIEVRALVDGADDEPSTSARRYNFVPDHARVTYRHDGDLGYRLVCVDLSGRMRRRDGEMSRRRITSRHYADALPNWLRPLVDAATAELIR